MAEQAGLAWPAFSAQHPGHGVDAFGVRQQVVSGAPRPISGNPSTSDSTLNQYFDSKLVLVDSASSTHGRHLTAMAPCDETSDHMEPMDLAALNRLLPDLDGDGDHHHPPQQQQQQQMLQASPASLAAGLGQAALHNPAGAGAPRPLRRGLGSTASVEEDIFSTVGGLELGGHDLAAAAAAGDGGGGLHGADHAGSGSGLGAGVPSAASLADLAPVDSPSRTLLVQNVSTDVSDEELRRLFAAHGDLRMLYTAAKACGLVIVGYFDLRAAVAAMTALQGFLLAGRPLDVAYSAPKKGEVNQINQGVVVVYNLDPDTTNEQLVWMFSRFGEVKDIQQAPQRSNQKFIEFFDVRHAAAALRAMNRAELSRLPGCSVAGSGAAAAAAAGDSSEGLPRGGSSSQLHRGSGDGGSFMSPRAAQQQQQRPRGSNSNLAAAMQQLGLDGQQQPSQVQPIPRPPGYDPVAQMSQRGMVRPVSGMLDRLHTAAVSPPMSLGPLSQSWDTSTGAESMLNILTRQQQQQQGGAGHQQGQQQQQASALQQLQQQQQQHQQQMFMQQALGLLRGSRQDLSTLDRVPETTTPDELQKLLHSSRGVPSAGPPSTGGAGGPMPVGSSSMHVSDSASSIASTGNMFGAGAAAAAAGLLGGGLHGGYHHLQPGQPGFAAAAAASQHPPLVPGSAAAAAAAAAAAVASSQAGGLNRSFGSSDQLHSMEHLAGMGQQQDDNSAAAAAAAAAMMAGGQGLAGNMSANNLAAAAAAAAGYGFGGDGGLTNGMGSASFDSGLNQMAGDAIHQQGGLGGLLGSHPFLLGAASDAAVAAAAAGSGLYPRTAGLGQGGMRSLSHPCLSLSAMAAAAAQAQQQQHQAAAAAQQQSAAAAAAAAANRLLSQQNVAAAAMLQAQAAAGLGLQELQQQAQHHQQQHQQAQQQLALQHLLQANLQAQSLAGAANLQAAQQLLQAGMSPHQLAAAGLLTPAALASLGLPTSSSYGTLHNLGALQLQSAAAAAAAAASAAGGSGIPRGASNSSLSGLDGRGGHRDGAGSRGGGRLSRRAADPAVEAERKAQQEKLFALDVERILNGEDKRTTLMIKNIPNKYTQKMLLQTIEEQFKGTFDFFYLPIDFKNKCNVGYAFINMLAPEYIPPLVARFNSKRWDKFNSEKVCNISYGRIQGRAALISHFQNSSLMHEDKRCRPVLFVSEGPDAGEPEPFPMGVHVRPRAGASAAGSSGSLAGSSQAGGSTAGAAGGAGAGAGGLAEHGAGGSSGSLNPGSRNSSSHTLVADGVAAAAAAAAAAGGGSSAEGQGGGSNSSEAVHKGPPGL